MKKFITIIALSLCLLLCSGEAIKSRSSLLRRDLAGDLHPKFRKLSSLGAHRLTLKVQGKGMFIYRMKDPVVVANEGDSDESMDLSSLASAGYDDAYSGGSTDGAPANSDEAAVDRADGTTGGAGDVAATDHNARNDLIFSHDGNLHVNRYGFLVDDNGFLLYGDGKTGSAATAAGQAEDSIHIPSRADSVIVTSDGMVLAEENSGAAYTDCGQILLARFANEAGLNVYDKVKSRCAAANKIGFSLGNWCAGSDLDGKEHTYYAKSAVSGAAVVAAPRALGFGKIVTA